MITAIVNGKMYAMESSPSWLEPVLITSYWPISTPALEIYAGKTIRDGYYIQVDGKRIAANLPSECAEFTQIIPIKRPSAKHVWHNGEWVKRNY